MTPAARIAAACEVLDEIFAGVPAEQALTGWARGHRFAGSKDRAALRDHVFNALRRRRSFAALGGGLSGRGVMIGAIRAAGHDPAEIFTGVGYAPARLGPQEQQAGVPETRDRLDLPDWLIDRLDADYGPQSTEIAEALRSRAPVFLRVNLSLATREEAHRQLASEGIETTLVSDVKSALKVTENERRIKNSEAYREGLIELQDAGSQRLCEALPLRPRDRVLDYCAGGGGKILALAARAGIISFAHDAHEARMRDLPARAQRARQRVDMLHSSDELWRHGPYDLVLCDVPCSGSGTWRRSPDAKWRLRPQELTELLKLQRQILSEASALVAKGGTLAYATCSVLSCENGQNVEAFLDEAPNFRLVSQDQSLPGSQGDGFFLATFQCLTTD